MRIEKINLHNFRNFEVMEIGNISRIVFFTGENGSGKTNILESISIISQLKSFRNAGDRDMIKWDNNSFHISITDDNRNEYEVGYSDEEEKIKKKIKLNGNRIARASDFYSRLLTVFFGPDDLVLIKGTPEIKRRYVDSVIAKMKPDYIKLLGDFKKILISRNSIIKEIKENKRNESCLDI